MTGGEETAGNFCDLAENAGDKGGGNCCELFDLAPSEPSVSSGF